MLENLNNRVWKLNEKDAETAALAVGKGKMVLLSEAMRGSGCQPRSGYNTPPPVQIESEM